MKVKGLKGYYIEDWINKIISIIDKIIETRKWKMLIKNVGII